MVFIGIFLNGFNPAGAFSGGSIFVFSNAGKRYKTASGRSNLVLSRNLTKFVSIAPGLRAQSNINY
jgi:hypothetical protein